VKLAAVVIEDGSGLYWVTVGYRAPVDRAIPPHRGVLRIVSFRDRSRSYRFRRLPHDVALHSANKFAVVRASDPARKSILSSWRQSVIASSRSQFPMRSKSRPSAVNVGIGGNSGTYTEAAFSRQSARLTGRWVVPPAPAVCRCRRVNAPLVRRPAARRSLLYHRALRKFRMSCCCAPVNSLKLLLTSCASD